MNKTNTDQYNELKEKKTLSVEETAVVNAYDAAKKAEEAGVQPAIAEANDVLEDAQEALVAKPSTTV